MTQHELKIGRKVKANREFSGIPVGTIGEIVNARNSWPGNNSVAIQWNRFEGDKLIDWFSFNDLKYLDIL